MLGSHYTTVMVVLIMFVSFCACLFLCQVLEYYEELKYWYKNGYALDLNYEMSCPLLAEMAREFR